MSCRGRRCPLYVFDVRHADVNWKWRWLAFRSCSSRDICMNSYIQWPRLMSSGHKLDLMLRTAIHQHIASAIVRYKDELQIYRMPTRCLAFNEWEAFWDVILDPGNKFLLHSSTDS